MANVTTIQGGMAVFNVPKRLTAKAKDRFEQEVMAVVEPLVEKCGIKAGNISVKAVKGNRGVFPSVTVLDADGTSREHYRLAQELKAVGINPAGLFWWSDGAFKTGVLFYPVSPSMAHPCPKWAEAHGIPTEAPAPL